MLQNLYEEAKKNLNSKCVVGKWADSLEESDRNAFDMSLKDNEFSSRALFDLYQYSMYKSSFLSDKYHLEEWKGKEENTHICKYCGVEVTTETDERCFKKAK